MMRKWRVSNLVRKAVVKSLAKRLPSSAEEGWREAPGWCWSNNNFIHQHHPSLG
jgi:hypothetical protein